MELPTEKRKDFSENAMSSFVDQQIVQRKRRRPKDLQIVVSLCEGNAAMKNPNFAECRRTSAGPVGIPQKFVESRTREITRNRMFLQISTIPAENGERGGAEERMGRVRRVSAIFFYAHRFKRCQKNRRSIIVYYFNNFILFH